MIKEDSAWLSFKNMIGKWFETSEKQPGKGTYERSYEIVLNKNFIEVKNKFNYPPSTNNPKGEEHEDHGFTSYNKGRKTLVLRQFCIDGFANPFKTEFISQPER
jgi:hypothetical protein